jgi:hypothetical protein
MKLRFDLYYFCNIGQNPDIAKIRRRCAEIGCAMLQMRPRKKVKEKSRARYSKGFSA